MSPDSDSLQEDKVVAEPPRRLFVHLPETSVAVADYLLGQGTEDCLANIKEVFGVEVAEDQIEGKAGGRQIPMVGSALYAVLVVAVSYAVIYVLCVAVGAVRGLRT